MRTATIASLLLVVILLCAVGSSSAGSYELSALGAELSAQLGETYTEAELAAIDRALWAGNMTREDMLFNKDYTKGYACFPIVRDMMHDPLLIAPFMDFAANELMDGGALFTVLSGCFGWSEAQLEVMQKGWGFRARPSSATEAAEYLEEVLTTAERTLAFEWDDREKEILREFLPEAMAWHDVFESTCGEERRTELEAQLEDKPDDYLYELAAREDYAGAATALAVLVAEGSEAENWAINTFPSDKPAIFDSRFGRIALGTPRDDYYEGEFAVLIEPDGNDTYKNCRLGAAYGTTDRRAGLFVDLDGDDFYDCGETNITLGAAVLGAGVFADLGEGNDRYIAGSCALGAAMAGCSMFFDDGGSDSYSGQVFTQGAAGYGAGLMIDVSEQPEPEFSTDEGMEDPIDIGLFDNDIYHAWTNSQAFARTKGIAICYNQRGNEVYEAGGVYLHAPLFSDRYQSFSQGFAIGERGIDYAGGIAMLIDYAGNDRYLGDIYNQGVGYWYSAGLLWDGGGNDTYEMTQYGQGSGIHLAVGGLVDVSGHDTYVMHSGLGQGGSHDYAASILHDRGGNDHYMGMTSCNGTGLTNAVGIHIDRSGNDTYAGRRSGGINWGRPARGTSSIGLLVDLEGTDDYLGIMADEMLWRHTEIGVGWDLPTPEPEPEPENAAGVPAGDAPIPEICYYEGELTQEVFDELWEVSIRWAVGDNSYIVPEARKRLIAFGADVLPYLSEVMNQTASSLAYRAFVDILGALKDEHGEAVADVLRENAASGDTTRNTVALYLIGELGFPELEDAVVPFLDDDELQRRAIGVLASIGSHAADEQLRAMLDPEGYEPVIISAMNALVKLNAASFEDLQPLLGHPLMSIREALTNLLCENYKVYKPGLREGFCSKGRYGVREMRTALAVLMRAEIKPDELMVQVVIRCLQSDDWGLRADAVRCLRRWWEVADVDYATMAPALKAMRETLATEIDPFVLFAGSEEL